MLPSPIKPLIASISSGIQVDTSPVSAVSSPSVFGAPPIVEIGKIRKACRRPSRNCMASPSPDGIIPGNALRNPERSSFRKSFSTSCITVA